MSLLDLEAVVRQRLGLDPEALGAAALPAAVERRAAARSVSIDHYTALVGTDSAEQGALAAELVVAETWFFRGGRRLFDALAGFVAGRAGVNPVRVLSVPCSTGEEPYSLAIALRDLGGSPATYRIEGVDISASHVARAMAGQFSAFAFRETGSDVRTIHFRQAGDRWELDPEFRDGVRFRVGNAADQDLLAGEGPFDLILCRNLFIYLTAEARGRVAVSLDRLLAPDGWLVLSPAEADRLPSGRFIATGPLEFGLYRRADSSEAVRPAATPAGLTAHKPSVRPPSTRRRVAPRLAQPEQTARAEPVTVVVTLELARSLADAGRLAEARAACERLIAGDADNADAYALLGTVRLAEGYQADAAEAFRKALYLEPNHAAALAHMILICDSRGDASRAAALRRRLARRTAEETT